MRADSSDGLAWDPFAWRKHRLRLRAAPRPRWIVNEFGGIGGEGVRVAVIDSGWDSSLWLSAPDVADVTSFTPSAVSGSDAVPGLGGDDHGHGTACITGVLRIAPRVTVYPLKVFDNTLTCSLSTLCRALEWAVGGRCDVVNLSLGSSDASAAEALYRLCEEAMRHKVIIVAATGEGAAPSFPAMFDNVIGVGAGDFTDPFDYSYHPGEAAEYRAASGHHGTVIWRDGWLMKATEASFAAPNICGIVALCKQRYRGATADDVREMLAEHAVNGPRARDR